MNGHTGMSKIKNMKFNAGLTGLCCLVFLATSGFRPGDGKVKRITELTSPDPTAAARIREEYEYDTQGRISKVTRPMYTEKGREGMMSFDDYAYDDSGRLSSVTGNNANINSPTGFIILKHIVYTWSDDGRKVKESIEYPQSGLSEYSLFIYDKGRLAKTEKYGYEGTLESYVVFEYNDSGEVFKETTFFKDGSLVSETLHTYTNGLNVKSDVYVVNVLGKDHLRTITRKYDSQNDLILLESRELLVYSSMSSYTLRYEY